MAAHSSMAALSIGHSFHGKNSPTQDIKWKPSLRTVVFMSSQGGKSPSDHRSLVPKTAKSKEVGQLFQQLLKGVGKLGEGLKVNLGPKQKGNWKDVVLMSLSFAVYVYISQKIVCIYCTYMSMIKHSSW